MKSRRVSSRAIASALAPAIALALAVGPAPATPVQAGDGQAPANGGEPADEEVAPAYQDRVIDPGRLPAIEDASAGDDAYDASGLPRGLSVDIAASHGEFGDSRYGEYGLAISGFRETAEWGSWSMQASVSRRDDDRLDDADGDWAGTATLWQRDLAAPGQWRGDTGLGVLDTPSVPLLREQYRFYLPSVAYAGASADWQRMGHGLRLVAGAGGIGHYTGSRLLGFERDEGHVGTVGAQWVWAPGWTGSATYLGSDGVLRPGSQGQPVVEARTAHAVHAATAWERPGDRIQLNLLASDADAGDATGAWLDGRSTRGRLTHRYGLFRLGQDLAWGSYPINNDTQGGYYRLDYQFARWTWNLGLDRIQSISGNGFEGTYGTAYARYQASSVMGYGGHLSVRDGDDRALGTQLFLDRRSDWGTTRLQWDAARDSGAGTDADSWQVTLDQAFPLRAGSRLSASLSHGGITDEGRAATRTSTVALYGGRDLTGRLSIDGQLRWTHGDGPDALRGLNANIAVNWQVNRDWSVLASLYQNQGTRRSPFELDPLGQDPLFIELPRERSVFLVLRYERQAGQPRAVLGGAPGTASADIEGSVFLDANGDGVRNAAEEPARQLTVILDGRYSLRTDEQGRFSFPGVAVGTHTIAVLPDNLPLPWYFEEGAAERQVEVEVRRDVVVDIPASRPR